MVKHIYYIVEPKNGASCEKIKNRLIPNYIVHVKDVIYADYL